MPTTMADVARVAGVSVKTVSNVINDYPYVRAETRARVVAAIDQLGYEVNLAARNLRLGRTGMIGLAVPELRQAYFGELADEVLRIGRERGVTVIIEPTGGTREQELQVLNGPGRKLTDGLLFIPVAVDVADVAAVAPHVPLVLLGEQVAGAAAGVDHVSMRDSEAVEAATRLLVERGRRRVAVVGMQREHPFATARLRYAGYLAALEACGIAFDPRLVGWAPPTWRRADGAAGMAAVLDSGAEPDGVVALNDSLAIGVLSELRARGLSVPDDVAVIGFDDTDEARFTDPPLTTVDPGRGEIARVAFDLLWDRLQRSGAPHEPVTHLASMRIVERGTTPPH
ncbi:LacI family DNA-binding transcriptional regulator [Cellulomonas sp. S1-8]|uniref:LacI family DNA-binding transcriptional regulator n=1 Tax=Cellulomonas sp. S1-8 TaxID=2904790 RepID=UPI002244BBB9|nr:LacI family DNA-binding transcriptional regulator [Cellulomonas sp. S1-8]UZN02332.1 LacI family transcriptional regulator [Cellulomonas sp. S1-8]UZN02399.1 LacI family transcriptional regulator [Cellulomonas sp. S1-8]